MSAGRERETEEKMAKKKAFIQGFNERLDMACASVNMPKTEIARSCGFDRKMLYRGSSNCVMNSRDVAKFCAFTKTDANWLLGIKR